MFKTKFSDQGASFKPIMKQDRIEGMPLQEKVVDIEANGKVEINPDDGHVLSKVVANVAVSLNLELEEKQVTPTKDTQYIEPSEGKYISKVVVEPISDEYIVPTGTKSITENGTHDVTEYAEVAVDVKSSVGVEEKQIIFIDYDGTLLYSYTPEEVLALTELPPHESTDELLIFDGWNWTLEDLKAEINLIGLDFMQNHKMAVGATYLTKDNISYFFITLNGYDVNTRKVDFYGGIFSSASAKIDWGDGSDMTSITGTSTSSAVSHTYESKGSYIIRVIVETGDIFLSSRSSGSSGIFRCGSYPATKAIVDKAYIGNVNTIYANGFSSQFNLKSVVISNKCKVVNNGAFSGCWALKAIVLPSQWVASSNSSTNGFAKDAHSLEYVSFPNKAPYPNTDYLRSCRSLRYAHLPMCVASNDKSYFLYEDVNLESIIITQTEDKSTAYGCYRLKQVLVREGVTSLDSTFYNCYSLTKMKMPSTIQTLVGNVFYGCYLLTEIDFTACTAVPTLSSTNAFNSVPSACKILVPASLYDEWVSATNWSSSAISIKIVAVEV